MYERSIALSEIVKPPLCDSQDILNMLCEVKCIMELATDEELSFAKYVDSDFSIGMFDILEKYCTDIDQSDVEAIKVVLNGFVRDLISIKNTYKVPRPYQIAPTFGVALPKKNMVSVSGIHFSYPSIHSAGSRCIAQLVSRKYQDCLGDYGRYEIFNHANRVAMSRIHLGVHSLQDVREGIRLADMLYS